MTHRNLLHVVLVSALIGIMWWQANSSAEALSGATEQPNNRIVSLRSSQQEGKVRLVIETTDIPDYQVYSQGDHLIIEVFNTALCGVQPSTIRDRSFVRSWKVSNPAIGVFRWDIACSYHLPVEQYRVKTLDKPHRLVVDLYTSWIDDEHYQLTPGVSWHRRQYYGKTFPYLLWNQVVFDPQDSHVKLDIAFGQDSTAKNEEVSSIVARKKALVGINGGYFNMAGGALGLVMRNGQIVSPHVSRRPPRSVFGFTKDKRAVFARAKAVNGQVLTLDNRVWPDIKLALGGGPRLVANGAMQLTTDDEALGPKGNDITRYCGRTAVSVDGKGRIAFSTASGYRDNNSDGIKLEQMAHLLLRSGATDGINLDGGGSVDMAIQGRLAAHGPDAGKYERPVANALVIYDDRKTTHPARIDVQPERHEVLGDGQSRFDIAALVTDEHGHNVADGTPVYFSAPGLLTSRALTTNGQAHVTWQVPRLNDSVVVTAKSGTVSGKSTIALKSDAPERLLARWTSSVKTTPVLRDQGDNRPQNDIIQIAPTPMFDFGNAPDLSSEPEAPEALEASITGAASAENGDGVTGGIENVTGANCADEDKSNIESNAPLTVQVIDFRARLIDKWHNGVANKTLELWSGAQKVGIYQTNNIGEVRATVQLSGQVKELELRCAGVAPIKMVL